MIFSLQTLMEVANSIDNKIRQLKPDFTGKELHSFLKNKLPPDFPLERYDYISCLGYARLLVLFLGGIESAQIYWIGEEDDESTVGDCFDNHAYVVAERQERETLAYNNTGLEERTVDFVLRHGVDITEEVFHYLGLLCNMWVIDSDYFEPLLQEFIQLHQAFKFIEM